MDGRMTRGLAAGGAVRVVRADVLGPALHTAAIHGLAPSAAKVAAEGIAAAVVLGASLKGEDRVTLQLQAERPDAALYVEVRGDGTMRARMTPARMPAGVPLEGLVLMIRASAEGEVYRGMTAVERESLTSALGRHLAESDQIDARLRVEVTTSPGGDLEAVEATLYERLPEEPGRPSITREEFAALADPAMEEVLDETPVIWRCACSRERVAAMLGGLPPDELDAMIREDHGAEVTCHFCQTAWRFDEAELTALAQSPAR
jgi:molecular chaperone Hsp33